MSFSGNLKTVSLPDVFQLIFTSKQTGALTISKEVSKRHIYFNEGMVVFAISTDEQDMLGSLLVKKGRITRLELENVLKGQHDGKKLGALLVETELCSREEIIEYLKIQIEEIVYNLFGWKDGQFEFVAGQTPPPETIQTELNPMNIIMEGTRRIDEWIELKKILPPDDAVIELVPDPPMRSDEMKLSRNEFNVLAIIGSGKATSKIVETSVLDQFQTCKALTNLLQMNLVRVGKAAPVNKTAEQEQKALVELLAQVYINNLIFIFDNFKEKMGVKGQRIIYETFQENKMFYPVLNQIYDGRDGEINFELFVDFYKKLPDEARIWRLVSNFNSLINDYLLALQKNLGNKIYRRVLSEIKINIQSIINRNRQLAMKYGLEEEFSRILRDR